MILVLTNAHFEEPFLAHGCEINPTGEIVAGGLHETCYYQDWTFMNAMDENPKVMMEDRRILYIREQGGGFAAWLNRTFMLLWRYWCIFG